MLQARIGDASQPAVIPGEAGSPAPKPDKGLKLGALGVRIIGGTVYSTWPQRELGPLAGASALVAGEVREHRVAGGLLAGAVVGPAGLLVGATTKGSATAMAAFGDGSTYSHRVGDKMLIPLAHRQVVQFNAAAAAASPPAS